MQNWRWDQGRGFNYFRFENIKNIAKGLSALEGAIFRRGEDPLRAELERRTGLNFPPANNPAYPVWRNFGRIFERCLLATKADNALIVTDVCKHLATSDTIDVDEYLSLWISRYYNPAPMSEGYSATAKQYFPFCAVLKYLLAAYNEIGGEPSISLDDVISLIIGNDCTGIEAVGHYSSLHPVPYSLNGDAKRQLREALIFVSQLSFLKWRGNRLYLDVLPGDSESIAAFTHIIEPTISVRSVDRAKEILSLGANASAVFNSVISSTRRQPADVLFTEGRRVRVTHLRTERSPILRKALFDSITMPYCCDMCSIDPRRIYPWTDNILEVHHLLPLSSTLVVTTEGTSLEDVVALCPNCHKSVHTYYKAWLNTNSREDFRSRNEANQVYFEAKESIRL